MKLTLEKDLACGRAETPGRRGAHVLDEVDDNQRAGCMAESQRQMTACSCAAWALADHQGCSTLSIEFPVEERIGSGESGSISILTEC